MIRITGGFLKGKKLADHDPWVRPTSTYRREMIFNILRHRYVTAPTFLDSLKVADVFAGTGALGVEALSRGAEHVTFIEKNPKTLGLLKAFLDQNSLEESTRLVPCSALEPPLASHPMDLLFLDPPYGKNLIVPTLEALKAKGWMAPDALVVTEADIREPLHLPEWMVLDLQKTQGRTHVYFLRNCESSQTDH